MYRSPISKIDAALSASRDVYKSLVCDVLNVSTEELNRLIEGALAVISGCAVIGWEIGSIFAGEQGGVAGAAIGAMVGIVIVIGAMTYRFVLRKTGSGLVAVPVL